MSKRRALFLVLLVAVAGGLCVVAINEPDPTYESDISPGEDPRDVKARLPDGAEELVLRGVGEAPSGSLPTESAREGTIDPDDPRDDTDGIRATSSAARGIVRDVGGQPISGAVLWWSVVHPTRWFQVVADDAGQFVIPTQARDLVILPALANSFPVPEDPWNLTGRIHVGNVPVGLTAKAGARLTVRAVGLDEVRGVVVDPTEVRVQVVCQSLPHPFLLDRQLSPSAKTEFGGINRKEGRYVVFVGPTSDGRTGLRWIHPPIPSEVEVRLVRAGRIAGRVEAPDPVLRGDIHVVLRDAIGFHFEVDVDAEGFFEFEGASSNLIYWATAEGRDGSAWHSKREPCRAGDKAVRLRGRDP